MKHRCFRALGGLEELAKASGWELEEEDRLEDGACLELRRAGQEPYCYLGVDWRSKVRPAVRVEFDKPSRSYTVLLGSERHWTRDELWSGCKAGEALQAIKTLLEDVDRLDRFFLREGCKRPYLSGARRLSAAWDQWTVEIEAHRVHLQLRVSWSQRRRGWLWRIVPGYLDRDPSHFERLLILRLCEVVRIDCPQRSTFLETLRGIGLRGLGLGVRGL